MTHKKFHKILVQDMIVQIHKMNITVSGVSRGRPSSSGAQLNQLEVKHSQHWPSKVKQRSHVCDVGLCVMDCFEKWHTHVKFVSTEWSYCKLWSDIVHTRVQSKPKLTEYSVIIFYKINMSQVSRKKKLCDSPSEFHNIYNKYDILIFVIK
jgi:hypothetical protein